MKLNQKIFYSLNGLILFISVYLSAVCAEALAQDFRVTDAHLKSNVSNAAGRCPMKITFTGDITVSAPGTVKYTFLRSDGAGTRIYEIRFKEAGTQPVSTEWTLGWSRSATQINGGIRLKILAPNEIVTSREDSAFSIVCQAEEIPPKEILGENEVEVLCPLERVKIETVTPFPDPWWQTPILSDLINAELRTIGGATALICDYAGFGLARRLPEGMSDCRANKQKNGFVCSAANAVVP
jgi:hypothetical protein